MSTEQVEQLTNQLSDSQNENKALADENAALKAENEALKETAAKEAKAVIEASNKEFIADMIKEGRVRPVDEVMHLDNMAAKDEAGLEVYKAWLKEFPAIVDVSGEEIASSTTAEAKAIDSTDDELVAEAKKIIAEKKCTYMEALAIIKTEKPELVK